MRRGKNSDDQQKNRRYQKDPLHVCQTVVEILTAVGNAGGGWPQGSALFSLVCAISDAIFVASTEHSGHTGLLRGGSSPRSFPEYKEQTCDDVQE